MSVSWSALGAEGQRIATGHFIAHSLAARLRPAERDEDAGPAARPSFADMYAWVTDSAHVLPAAQQEAIQADPVLRRSLALLVGRVGQLRAVAAAAASSGGLDARSGPGFTVRLTVSRADPAHTYVTVEIDAAALPAGVSPGALLVLRGGAPVGKLALPDGADGVIQLMESSDAAVVRGIRAADTELVLV